MGDLDTMVRAEVRTAFRLTGRPVPLADVLGDRYAAERYRAVRRLLEAEELSQTWDGAGWSYVRPHPGRWPQPHASA